MTLSIAQIIGPVGVVGAKIAEFHDATLSLSLDDKVGVVAHPGIATFEGQSDTVFKTLGWTTKDPRRTCRFHIDGPGPELIRILLSDLVF